MRENQPKSKLTVIGGGIIGAMEAYFAYLEAKKKEERARITVYEKNGSLSETTAFNIVPSLTPDEILSVVPRGEQLEKKLHIRFDEPGGIRIDDVAGVNDSDLATKFKEAVRNYGKDESAHHIRTEKLLTLGKFSMDLWQQMYDEADLELKTIFRESNFNPCREPKKLDTPILQDGYRVDVIYKMPKAAEYAESMKLSYQRLGYASCKVLSPSELKAIDPFLSNFCEVHSTGGKWHDDAVALWRPGGCLDTQIFLPKFYAYLEKVMGEYFNESGQAKKCFKLKFDRKVTEVHYKDNAKKRINGLRFFQREAIKYDKSHYETSDYVFCPGEAVGTLEKLGFKEPSYSGFAGATLRLALVIPQEKILHYSKLNHCMEVHQEGVVLAWQVRMKEGKMLIGVGGTKAFYADKKPHKDEDFGKNRNLLQLNMINDLLPDLISLALNKNTRGQILREIDLDKLEQKGIAVRWTGIRAVAYDGHPTLGDVFNSNGKVENARCTTHFSSGGVSFAPAGALFSRQSLLPEDSQSELTKDILQFGSSMR